MEKDKQCIIQRPRRNRKHSAIRNAFAETTLGVEHLIQPLFILDPYLEAEGGAVQKITSMPGIYRFSLEKACLEIVECIDLGISQFILFPVVSEKRKDSKGSYGYTSSNFYLDAIAKIKAQFSDIIILTDVALDPYNSDGHDGLVSNGEVKNDETLALLSQMALLQAQAGADVIAPSDMMDGRVGCIRQTLDTNSYIDVSIMAYTAKYASAFYSPFRDALTSVLKMGDKKTYQMDYRNINEAIREAELDIIEGADSLIVKPALCYLDVIACLSNKFPLPVIAYHVSGEYAMLKVAVQKDILENEAAIKETLYSIRRAGANSIITYCCKEFAKIQA